jgi:Ca2+-binding RTX toxin-like protein
MRRASLAAFAALVLSASLLSGTASGSTPRFRYDGTTPEGPIVRLEVGGSRDGVVWLHSLLETPARPEGPRAGQECTIVGTAGDDDLEGTQHDDVICALAGEDQVSGGDGDDTLILGPGDDGASGEAGDDVIRGGGGRDWVILDGPGSDRIYGQGDSDVIYDHQGFDVLSGGGGNDCMNAGDRHGGDVIRGGQGRDEFWANDGDEVLSAEVETICIG